LDHLGLVAGMFDELGIGDVLDHATHQNPAMRDLTGGEAGKAMVLNGLGLSHPRNYPYWSQIILSADHHGHCSSSSAVWADPDAHRDDLPRRSRPLLRCLAASTG
jgi:hypothetical protein